MFILFLLLLVVAGYFHGKTRRLHNKHSRYELILVYLIAGYCGIIMVGVSLWGMIVPSGAAAMLGTEPGNPFQDFFLVAYLGMAVMATLSILIRGSYLIANVICWSIYWFGATYLHFADFYEASELTLAIGAQILGAHALGPILMIVFLVLSIRKDTTDN